MLTVYRVERPDGKGPYRNGHSAKILELTTSAHPVPTSDGLGNPYWGYEAWESDPYYGFRSLEQAFTWFDTEDVVAFLHDRGYYLAMYEVEDGPWTDEGWSQVCFDRGHAECVESRDIIHAWKEYNHDAEHRS